MELLREQVKEQEEHLAEIEETNRLKQKLKENEKKIKHESKSETEKTLERLTYQGAELLKKGIKELHERNQKREREERKSAKQEEGSIW